MSDRQLLYGLSVESEMELHQDRPASNDAPADVTVRWAPDLEADSELPAGRILVHLEADVPYYTFVECVDGSQVLRFHGTCDFEISTDLSQVSVRLAKNSSPGMASVLTTGAMLAYQLYRREQLVLHSSAVSIGDRALAFVGNSGMGKTTMAALMCADGATLITDDVLRVDQHAGVPVARLGATELRLRKGADTLAARFVGAPDRRTSADDRQVLQLSDGAIDRLPLAAIVIPQPHPDRTELELTRLSEKAALFAVLNFPRLLGWRDPAVIARQFAQVSSLVQQVPVLIARVPWGPPFQPDLGTRLWDAVRLLTP